MHVKGLEGGAVGAPLMRNGGGGGGGGPKRQMWIFCICMT